MAVKDILKYKQRGDRTAHWVKENSRKHYTPLNLPWVSASNLTVNPGQIWTTQAQPTFYYSNIANTANWNQQMQGLGSLAQPTLT